MNTAATHLLMFPPQDGDHNGKKVFRNRIHFFMQQREYQKYLEYRLYLNLDLPTFSRNFHIATCMMYVLQVNLSQKLSFLNQLTHNMTRDCSLNSPKDTSSQHLCANIYLAHVIEQPNFRIPNPQYFVYLLDQTVGQDTLQFIH